MNGDMSNLDRLFEAGLVRRDLPAEYAQALDELPAEHIDVILEVQRRLDNAAPQAMMEWGQRWWTVFMVF